MHHVLALLSDWDWIWTFLNGPVHSLENWICFTFAKDLYSKNAFAYGWTNCSKHFTVKEKTLILATADIQCNFSKMCHKRRSRTVNMWSNIQRKHGEIFCHISSFTARTSSARVLVDNINAPVIAFKILCIISSE